ncbi:MAG: hypothetical protein HOM52_08110 [Rhodospirillaceae bacterium]|nr:hypothetical protein [Rhodospirillaceae bacterium]MBT3628571.1 hypothetical protein [Rhodospirillaceae bacterium]MBT3925875.1 hypothetical protein [Rhodospirillaceae bacterium]MBT4427608.1 hypothetical protein [Rhodospirillaceae bacterium]MBT5038461.1 hypothetical protein [Rhodospirillaceae bacterium]
MTVTAKSIDAINQEMQEIPITEERIGELPVELNQLLGAAKALRGAHDFDSDPANFQQVLHAVRD